MSVRPFDAALVDAVDAVLPQTQCRRCGYDACRPYAQALVAGVADINRCPPGGDATIERLAVLLGRTPCALDPGCGEFTPRNVALIDEQWCIGCTICIRVCPVDAIAGARRLMHTVIADACSGCELCVAPCPVDCIRMVPVAAATAASATAPGWFQPWSAAQAAAARERHQAREQRSTGRRERAAARRRAVRSETADAATRRAEVQEAVRRVRARRTRGAGGDEQ